jgi:Flp pilus assembly pilin Flp
MTELIRRGVITIYDGLRPLARAQDGQALVEYALIMLLIVLVSVGALQLLGQDVSSFLSPIANDL